MADASTIARPYAKAVFELANSSGQLPQWGELLQGLAQLLSDSGVARIIDDPKRGGDKLAADIIEALRGQIDVQGENFIRLLAENGRLNVVTEITDRYQALRAEAERTVDVQVTSATGLDEDYKQQLTQSLRRRLGREVRLHCEVDESLIGGAVIRAGDLVIDGSMRGRISDLATALNA